MPINIKPCHVLVVGDLMLDKYWMGDITRISPEAPVPVVNVKKEETRIGGAGNVALNTKALTAKTSLLGLIGQDEAGERIKALLNEQQIDHYLQQTAEVPTTTKLRVLSQRQQTIRLDFESAHHVISKKQLLDYYSQVIADVDVVIFSDYQKGALSDITTLIEIANTQQVPVLVDPKGHDFSIYRGADLIKPNRKEFEWVVGPCETQQDMIEKGQALIQAHEIAALLITLGEDGMLLIEANGETHAIPASSGELVDVTGAGDTVIATFAVAKASGKSNPVAMHLANLAAGVAVSRLGAVPVTLSQLTSAYMHAQPIAYGITEPKELAKAVQAVQAQGQRVVFTNGCFDILHAGHVSYLEKAKALGDKLIVAINSDESIKRLKGPSRPISPLLSRLKVLATLRPIDWVVVFEEDTPEALLSLIKPDVLVKGGDYTEDGIVGAEIVKAYGGHVQAIQHDYLHLSSTQLINRMDVTVK